MKFRVVACSDVHIGNYGTATDENGVNLGFLSNRRCRDFLLDYCRKNPPDVGIFVGDLYRSAIGRPTQTEQMEAAKFFKDWSFICPCYLKPGNHDVGEFTREGHGVHALEIFGAMNYRMKVLPKEDWSVIDVAGVKIGLFHGMLANVKLESGMNSNMVKDDLPSMKNAPPADFYLLGDIHKRQFVANNAAYCGSIDRLNFNEQDETPSFWDITVDKDDKTGVVKVEWTAVPTPARRFVTVNKEDDIYTADVKGAIVRYEGELKKYTETEVTQIFKRLGAIEVTNVTDTSVYEEVSESIFTSFVPTEAYSIWLDAQTEVTKEIKNLSQELLTELV